MEKTLIRKIWSFTHKIWEARNRQLHETDKIDLLQRLPYLKEAALQEWTTGLGILPAHDFSHMFTTTKKELQKKSMESLRSWLSIIRNGRYLHGDKNIVHDEYSTDTSMNTWLGLKYYKDKHGKVRVH